MLMNETISNVVRGSEVPVEQTPWGSLQWLVGRNMPQYGMTVGRVTFKPGESNPIHAHPNCDEVLFVVSGAIEHSLPGGGTVLMNPGDCIALDRRRGHRAKNVGTTEAVVMVVFNSSERQTESAQPA
jgi:quercetin dioxygenase-like cupin family protein